jgi:tRNA modification GTPase
VDTIAAVATPPGRGAVAIVRISGPATAAIAEGVLGRVPPPRLAVLARFRDTDGTGLDDGLALFFPGPHSFTGEDVLELQGHGGPVVVDMVLARVLALGARLARAGEFSERAFLNGKLDLAQAEAIADLIDSGTTAAARLAARSLEGEFSRQVQGLAGRITRLRTYVEAAIDFPEEEVDFLSDGKVSADLDAMIDGLEAVRRSARIGCLLREGMTVVIAGRPNAGKSSIMNALAGRESAIVTEVAGTTRDLLREEVQIEGMPVHLIDTAGLRDSGDPVELEGMRRARAEIDRADLLLWVFDDQADPGHLALDRHSLPPGVPLALVRNKIDLTGTPAGLRTDPGPPEIALSVVSGAGMDALRDYLKSAVGYDGPSEGGFIARRRHLHALERAARCLEGGRDALEASGAGELLAEDLRSAHSALQEITGAFTADDLLGEIFASFCIGK